MLTLDLPEHKLKAGSLADATLCVGLHLNQLTSEPYIQLTETRWFSPSLEVLHDNVTRWHHQEMDFGVPREDWQWQEAFHAVTFPARNTPEGLAQWHQEIRRLIWKSVTGIQVDFDNLNPEWQYGCNGIRLIQNTLLADLLTRTGDLK